MQNRASPPSNTSGSLRLSPNDLAFQHVELKGSLYKSLNFFNSKFITSNLYLTHLDSANFLFINTFPVHQCYSHWENATFSKISFRYYRFFLMCIMQLQFQHYHQKEMPKHCCQMSFQNLFIFPNHEIYLRLNFTVQMYLSQVGKQRICG